MLDERYREQMEYTIGRPLEPEELVVVDFPRELTEKQLELGRTLAQRQNVLCAKYLRAVVKDLDLSTAIRFMDDVLKSGEPAKTWQPR